MILSGSHEHSVDSKGRIFVPSELLTELCEVSKEPRWLWVTRGAEGCLWLYPDSVWRARVAVLEAKSDGDPVKRKFMRQFIGLAKRREIDASNRILIPDELRRLAGITDKAVFLGQSDKIELWDHSRHVAESGELSDADYSELAKGAFS